MNVKMFILRENRLLTLQLLFNAIWKKLKQKKERSFLLLLEEEFHKD
jgi:hypothetical protein